MILRVLGTSVKQIESVIKRAPNANKYGAKFISEVPKDVVDITSKRTNILNLYKNKDKSLEKIFAFNSNGEITVHNRMVNSKDLQFLDFIREKKGIPIKFQQEGSANATKEAIENSNQLAKEFISESEHFVDGFRYNSPKAIFDSTGKNISRFSSGNSETIIIDRTKDKILNQTIETFKKRISNKNLSEEEKTVELMKFVDEIFSFNRIGAETENALKVLASSSTKEVFLGDLINSGIGVCRHRALMTKLLGDEIGLKTRLIQGKYASGGHAWNEILIKDKTILFDAMHGNMFEVFKSNNILYPQARYYSVTNPKNENLLIQKYFDLDSKAGKIFSAFAYKRKITTNIADFIPTKDGYTIIPKDIGIKVNGKEILDKTFVQKNDWMQIKDMGIEIP